MVTYLTNSIKSLIPVKVSPSSSTIISILEKLGILIIRIHRIIHHILTI
nr:MAG TPA: hypothetical protein [Bacteriophage sp.]